MAGSPTLNDVREAAEAIAGRVHRTPMLTSATLAERCGAPVWLKAELFQRIGAFKPRGAFNRLRALTPEERELGTITISAGNHAQALALAARDEGVDALVLMPADASPAKVAAARGYGATVDLESADSMEALERMRAIAAETGRVVVHPYDDPLVVAGQGTVGLEIVEDAPAADTVIVPIGGGGLIAGIATAVKGLRPDARSSASSPSCRRRCEPRSTPAIRSPRCPAPRSPTRCDRRSPGRSRSRCARGWSTTSCSSRTTRSGRGCASSTSGPSWPASRVRRSASLRSWPAASTCADRRASRSSSRAATSRRRLAAEILSGAP